MTALSYYSWQVVVSRCACLMNKKKPHLHAPLEEERYPDWPFEEHCYV